MNYSDKEKACPICDKGTIEPVKGTEPYSEDYLMCNKCDSTFNKEEKKPQFTKEQAKDIIQCIFGTHFQFVQNDGESYIENLIHANYIIDFKPEELIIVHNVLKYKGEYYLKQVATNNCISCALYNKTDCYITGNMCCDEGFNWKSFKNIQITDELACMRKDIGDIYIIVGPESYRGIHVLYGVKDGELISNDKSREYSLKDGYVRLATTEEIKEYMEKNNGK